MFIYYCEGDISKRSAPDIYVVFGATKRPRYSFYTWAEGAVPATVFEFLSDVTANRNRYEKVRLYLIDIGVEEYFIHQPEPKNPPEFRGWRRSPSGEIVEIAPYGQGGLFSEALNLWFRWEEQPGNVRLLRPYLPDGPPIPTSMEEKHFKEEAQAMAEAEVERRREESQRRRKAEILAKAEAERRREAEAELEQLRAQLANREDEGA